MDPFTLAIGAMGLASTVAGGFMKMQGAAGQTEAELQKVALEEQQDSVRRQAMEVAANRQQMENMRNVQKARAMALAGGVAGGSQFGSMIGGKEGQIGGEGGTNELGISQNLQAGEQMFDLNKLINDQKMAYFKAGGEANMGAGLQSFGSGITSNLKGINELSGFGQGLGGLFKQGSLSGGLS